MNLFIQQEQMPKMSLAYTIATNYETAYKAIEDYLKLADIKIEEVTLYHAEIMTISSKVQFLYTPAVKEIENYNKTEIQILTVEAENYLSLKIEKKLYQQILFENKELKDRFNKEIDDYCDLHEVYFHMPAFPYLAYSTDGYEKLYFPIKKRAE